MCCHGSPQLKTAHLGMGTAHTWHEFPDARCYTVDMLLSSYDFWDEYESASSPVDGKYSVLGIRGLNQVTGHAVVTSFVHANLFPEENHLLPALLINSVQVAVALYDTQSDVLMHVLPITWRVKNPLLRCAFYGWSFTTKSSFDPSLRNLRRDCSMYFHAPVCCKIIKL